MILVTGDKGWVGSVLTQKLKDYRGYDVVDGYDLNDVGKLAEALKGVDMVVHLAAIVGEEACAENPESAYVVNTFGTWRLVDLAYVSGVKKLVMASTCSVYGDCGETLVDETTVPKPWGVYTISKFMAENYVAWRGQTILRFGGLYGGNGNSLPEVMRREAIKGAVVVNAAESRRPLTHVEDAVNAILFVLAMDKHPKTLNVVGENIRKGDLARLIAERYGAEVKVMDGESRSYRVSSKRLLDLGFKFEWNLRKWLG